MRIIKILMAVLIPLAVVIAGIAGMQWLSAKKTPPVKEARKNPGALVATMNVLLENRPTMVWATGTVQPRMIADIVPQISGKVIRLDPAFVTGGVFKKGDLLFRVEAVDYELAAQTSRAAVAKAEYEIAEIESKARVARLEWERIQMKKKSRPNPLVLYVPQLKNARAALASAQADLEQRLTDIRRTKIYAPFNCRIRSESIDPGQYITTGSSVAVVCGTDSAEVVTPVSFADLQWIPLSQKQDKKIRSRSASVRMDVEGQFFTWQGWVDRTLGEVDPKGRMARLVIGVPDPYGLISRKNSFDLAEGLFVEVLIKGKTIENIACIPAGTLRPNSIVWVMNDKQCLEFRKVKFVRREKQIVLVRGLKEGEKLILTYLAGAVPGMKLRAMEESI